MPESLRSIDLNADLGEGCPWDPALLGRVTSASVCCGAHAGGEDVSKRTLEAASRLGVVVGAHPGFPDREHFGRRERSSTAVEVEAIVAAQVDALAGWAAEVGATLRFVKPHGALYNQAGRDPEIAGGIVAALRGRGLPVLGLPGGALEAAADRAGLPFVGEGFADRRYRPDGSLVPRSEPDALIGDPEEAAAQAIALAGRGVATLCLHGDDPRAVGLADRLREALGRAGIAIAPFVGRDG